MIRFNNFINQKILNEAASQKHRIMMKRPTPLFPDAKNIKIESPPKLTSRTTQMELKDVQDAMIMSDEKLKYLKDLDVNYMKMMSEIVGGEIDLIEEIKRQIDTTTLNMKYSFNRLRPLETAEFYGKTLTPHVKVDTPSYPSNHTAVGYTIAGILSRKYPEHKKELDKVANDNAISRVELGVHFMSDVEAGRELAEQLLNKYQPEEELVKPKKKYRYGDLPAPVYGKEAY
tara:strand:- start:5998 stop:6687 length:690 start_codon:yes stop_codon:yes gene_type:complete